MLPSLLLSTILLATGSPQEKQDAAALYQKAKAGIVGINTGTGSGTGFVFREDRLVATCYHVIAGAKNIKIKIDKDKEVSPEAIYFSRETDAALLKLPEGTGLPVLPVGDPIGTSPGSNVFVIGNPLGFLDHSITSGILSAKRDIKGTLVLQITAPVSEGSSGSPVLNDKGEVLGFVSYTFTEGQAVNMAIGCEALANLLTQAPMPMSTFALGNHLGSPVSPTVAKTATTKFSSFYSAVRQADLEWQILLWNRIFNIMGETVPTTDLTRQAQLKDRMLRESTKPFAEFVGGAKLWSTNAATERFDKAVTTLTEAIGDNYKIILDGIDVTKAKNAEDKVHEIAVKIVGARSKLDDALWELFDSVGSQDWFDLVSFRESLNPAVYAHTFTPSLSTIIPDPREKQSAKIGACTEERSFEHGDVIVALKYLGQKRAVKGWEEVEDLLDALPEEADKVTVIVLRNGKQLSFEAEVAH